MTAARPGPTVLSDPTNAGVTSPMAETLSLMEFLQALLADAGLRGDFGDDPQGTLAAHGLADLTPADVHDALVLVQDTQTVDYSLDAATAPPAPPPAGD